MIFVINWKIKNNNSYKDLFRQININKAQAIKANKMLSYDSLQTEEGSIKASVVNANKLLEKLLKLGDKCPTCEQPVNKRFKKEERFKYCLDE